MGQTGRITDALEQRIYEGLHEIPLIDIHTHVEPGKPHADTLCDIVSYHFVLADLEAAGLPREAWQGDDLSPKEKVAKAIPFFKRCRNTGTFRCLENLLRDLYGVEEPLSPDNWEQTYEIVEQKGREPDWPNRILREKVNLSHIVVDYAGRAEKCLLAPELFSYTLETGALGWAPRVLDVLTAFLGHFPRSAQEIEDAVKGYIEKTIPDEIRSITLPVPIHFRAAEPGSREVDRILLHDRGLECSSELEKMLVVSHVIHAALRIYEERNIHVAMSLGQRRTLMDGKPGKTVSKFDPQTLPQIGNLAACYPGINFFVLLCSYPMNQDLTLLAKMQPNVVPTGYWWHAMYPEYVGRMLSERLDVLPYTRFLGFFSDAYMVEWVYGKSSVVRNETARVLAAKVRQGYYTEELAMEIAWELFHGNPRRLYLSEED